MGIYEILKLFVYGVAIVEILGVAHLYFYAWREMKKTKIIGSMFLFLASIVIYFVYRFLFSYSAFSGLHITGFRQASIIPVIPVLLSARNLRIQSLKKTIVETKLEG